MQSQGFEGPDADRATLLAIVATIDREMSHLPGQAGPAEVTDRLTASWAELVRRLGLAAQARECPVCGHLEGCEATVCGYCWTTLPRTN
jgi:hypothetical protein